MNEVHLVDETGQEERLFGGTVAPADDSDIHFPIKGAVAGGTGRYTLSAVKLLFAGNSGHPGRSSRGDDDALGQDRPVTADQFPRKRGKIDRGHQGLLKTGAELGRLLSQVFHQLEAVYAFGGSLENFRPRLSSSNCPPGSGPSRTKGLKLARARCKPQRSGRRSQFRR